MATTQLGPTTVSTVGELPAVGSQAPGFDLVDSKFQALTDADVSGKRVVLNIFPSIDTGVCQASVRRFNELAAGLDNTTVVNVSVDLPLAQARFCGAEGIENVVTGSAFRSSFGEDLGVTMQDGPLAGLLSRAVVITDADGKVVYTEQVSEVTEEPDYDAAKAALDTPTTDLPGTWAELAAGGLLGMHVPEEHGGQGGGLQELSIVVEELGRAVAPGPFLPTVVAAGVVVAAATAQDRARWLPGLADGSLPAALGLGGSLVLDGTTVSGDAGPVLSSGSAALLLLRARSII